jgi:hypothetical protein
VVTIGTDIAKRSFYVREGKAVFYYSFDQDKMTGKVQTFLFHGSKSQVAGTPSRVQYVIDW